MAVATVGVDGLEFWANGDAVIDCKEFLRNAGLHEPLLPETDLTWDRGNDADLLGEVGGSMIDAPHSAQEMWVL